ncbi:hypothetical protein D7294_08570 [Streptomyces hoynatensis]|uniref:Uncharacterized protein n=2 Tax=Streptomyces hoynatensis TaxID=1141874 RepID=A0A3A9Z5U1_9ACTN|nr:hypothetical protein D7294_08570 [Streptomyces hoynatensis]
MSEDEMSAAEAAVNTFVGHAAGWAQANAQRITAAYNSDGGWELWLELELYLWLRANSNLSVSRQARSYAGAGARQRADLLLDNEVIVELKAETSAEKPHAFAARVDKDREKVDAIEEPSGSEESEGESEGGTPAVVVAFVVDEATAGEMVKLGGFLRRKTPAVDIFFEHTS